jgi:hypothetical protein
MRWRGKPIQLLAILLVVALGAVVFRRQVVSAYFSARQLVHGRRTVAERVAEFEAPVRARLEMHLQEAGLTWPPARLTLAAFKDERLLEAWAANSSGPWRLLKRYPILGASGNLGPKLADGDRQVPEGVYHVESLNPNSAFHLALRVSYPNAFDREKGAADGRTRLGSDIMIHGSRASIGCLAMGDPAAEELFILAAKTGLPNTSIILSPVDFRRRDLPASMAALPRWSPELYEQIKNALRPIQTEPPANPKKI